MCEEKFSFALESFLNNLNYLISLLSNCFSHAGSLASVSLRVLELGLNVNEGLLVRYKRGRSFVRETLLIHLLTSELLVRQKVELRSRLFLLLLFVLLFFLCASKVHRRSVDVDLSPFPRLRDRLRLLLQKMDSPVLVICTHCELLSNTYSK